MSSNKASFFTRLRRLCRLTVWLFKTGKNLRGIDGGCPKSRNRAVIALGKGALAALDIGLEVGRPAPEHPNGVLVAANHVSWLDIFAMSAVYPSSFIAKQEIKSLPVLGKMGQNAGTVFINRNSRRDIEPINRAVCETLQRGQNVSFFPEARTSSGLYSCRSRLRCSNPPSMRGQRFWRSHCVIMTKREKGRYVRRMPMSVCRLACGESCL